MTWPLPVLPTDRTNDTDQLDLHPADHNALANAVNELNVRTSLLFTDVHVPVLSGMAVGTGGGAMNQCRWTYIGPRPFTAGAGAERGLVFISGQILFGTAGTTFPGSGNEGLIFNTAPTWNMHFDRQPTYLNTPIGHFTANISGWLHQGIVAYASETSVNFYALRITGSEVYAAGMDATVPRAWVAGSTISYAFTIGAILQ